MHEHDYYGDKFKWFVGVVKEKDDFNRVRVRVYGIHRMDDITDVSDEDLPWATVLLPATSGETGSTNGTINLDTGDWVVGFFADGDDCQQPIVIGVVGKGKDSDNYSPTGGDDGTYDDGTGGGGGDGGGDGGDGGGGSDDDLGGGTPQNDSAMPGNSVAEKVYVALKTEFLKRTGGNEDKAHMLSAAVMGNMEQESSFVINIQNTRILKRTGRPEASFGLIQWFEDRRVRLFKHTFGSDLSALPESARRALLTNSLLPGGKRVVGIPIPGAADQVSFLFWELDHGEKPGALNAFMQQNSLKGATNVLAKKFIVPAVVEPSRYTFAQKWDRKFRNYRVAPNREL
jgi:hypothetical protein